MALPTSLLSAPLTDLDLELVHGVWPEGLGGEMVISAPLVDPSLSYQLFGFGVLLRLSLSPGTHGAPADRFALRQRVLDTPVRRLHEALPHAFRAATLGFESPFGAPNMVNTAPLPWDGRLFATWDVGRPVEVDPVSLGFLAEVGDVRSWGGGSFPGTAPLPMLLSSAHPVIDPERSCMWTVKLVPGANGLEPWVVRYDGEGTAVRHWRLAGAGVHGSMHTVSQTEHWLVLSDSGNFKADMGELAGRERSVTIDDEVTVYFVRKDELDRAASGSEVSFTSARFGPTTGHYYAVWDDDGGRRVRVLFEHMDVMDLGYRLRSDDLDVSGEPIDPRLVGFYQMAMAPQSMSEIVFAPEGGTWERVAATRHDWSFNLQLSAQDWSLAGQRSPTHHHVVFQGYRPGAIARRVLAVYGDRVHPDRYPAREQHGCVATFRRGDLALSARWELPDAGDLPSSPIFVPRPGGQPGGGDGWVVVPVLGDAGARIEVLDASDVGAGPVATLSAGGACLPFLLHAAWMPEAAPAAAVERLSFVDELEPAHVERLGDDERRALQAVCASFGS